MGKLQSLATNALLYWMKPNNGQASLRHQRRLALERECRQHTEHTNDEKQQGLHQPKFDPHSEGKIDASVPWFNSFVLAARRPKGQPCKRLFVW
jgi:hypothetical protein